MLQRTRTCLSAALVPGLIAGALAITAAPALAASCYVSANSPSAISGQVYGVANRSGCGDYVELQAWLMYQKSLWPDPNMGYGERKLTNGSVKGSGPCSRYGRGYYYTSARTDTGQKSPNSQTTYLC